MAKKAGRGAAAMSGAATAAQIGGMTYGVPGAIAGAGIGALGGAIFGGDEAAAMRQEELEELKRRQELGALGLTDQETQVAMGQAQGALSQQQQAQRAQQAGLLASQDLGAGATFKKQSEEAVQQRRAMEDAAQKVRVMDQKRRLEEEGRIAQLTNEVSVTQQKMQNEAFAGIVEAGTAFGKAKQMEELATLDKEQLEALGMRQNMAYDIGVNLKGGTFESRMKAFMDAYGGA